MALPPLTTAGLTIGATVLTLLLGACGTQGQSSAADEPSGPVSTPGSSDGPATSKAATPASKGKATGAKSARVPDALRFSGRTVSGEEFDGAELAGTPVVLWFWAPWCPTCRGQIDDVSSLAQEYGDEVAFVGVGSLDDAEAIAGFAADVPEEGMVQVTDPDGDIWRHFGITAQSTFVVLDQDGSTVTSGYVTEGEVARLVADLAG